MLSRQESGKLKDDRDAVRLLGKKGNEKKPLVKDNSVSLSLPFLAMNGVLVVILLSFIIHYILDDATSQSSNHSNHYKHFKEILDHFVSQMKETRTRE